jgi:hypothetical protein
VKWFTEPLLSVDVYNSNVFQLFLHGVFTKEDRVFAVLRRSVYMEIILWKVIGLLFQKMEMFMKSNYFHFKMNSCI